MDYPSVLQHPEEAAKELDRLTSDGRIFWYAEGDAPPDLDIGPTTLILKSERVRLVHDWTRVGLNQCLETPPTKFDTMDDFLDKLRPNAFMAGLDIRDCFYHWPIHPESRRRLGVRHPISRRLGVYLFLPPGLSAAPGYNEQFVGTMVDAAKRGLSIHSCRFVDDLRITNVPQLAQEEDKRLLNVQLHCFKTNLEALGLRIHSKPGKFIEASQEIEWLGWAISTVQLRVWLTPTKQAKGLMLCQDLLERHLRGDCITSRQVMSVAGFLNFITGVIKRARPYLRTLYQCIAASQVYSAWKSGKR